MAMQKYSKVNQEIRKNEAGHWVTDQCQEIDSGIRTGNSEAACKTEITDTATTDKLVTEEQATHKRWLEYRMQLIKTMANIFEKQRQYRKQRNGRSTNTKRRSRESSKYFTAKYFV